MRRVPSDANVLADIPRSWPLADPNCQCLTHVHGTTHEAEPPQSIIMQKPTIEVFLIRIYFS